MPGCAGSSRRRARGPVSHPRIRQPFGRYYYLTRLAAPATLQVEHRWYRGDRLVQSVPLTIRASGGSGFRTYSRQTVPEAQPGEWRVEVRSQQGAVLAEERFTVR